MSTFMAEKVQALESQLALREQQVEMLRSVIEQQSEVTQSARHLIEVLSIRNSEGAVFAIDPDNHEPNDVALIQNALIDLSCRLDCIEPPPLALPEVLH